MLTIFNVDDLRQIGLCYDPVTGRDDQGNPVQTRGLIDEYWQGSAYDVLEHASLPAADRAHVLLGDAAWFPDNIWRAILWSLDRDAREQPSVELHRQVRRKYIQRLYERASEPAYHVADKTGCSYVEAFEELRERYARDFLSIVHALLDLLLPQEVPHATTHS